MGNNKLSDVKLKIQGNVALKALLINIAVLIFYLLFFHTQLFNDDLMQWYSLSGVFSGQVDKHMLWSDDLIALLLRTLTLVAPKIQWFAVFQVCLSFVALYIVTYIILSYGWKEAEVFIIVPFLLVYGFECYSAMMFTKTAGIVISVAVFGFISSKSNNIIRAVCLVLFALSCSLRDDFLYMAIAAEVFFVFAGIIKKDKSNRIKSIIQSFLWLAVAVVLFKGATYATQLYMGTDEAWQKYSAWDGFRSAVFDYGKIYDDYDLNADEYAKLGITKSEAELWAMNNNDIAFPSGEVRKEAVEIANSSNYNGTGSRFSKLFSVKSVIGFFKQMPLKWLTVDVVYVFLLFVLFLCVAGNKRWTIYSISMSSLLMFAFNYYLVCSNRYLKHRVDVGLVLLCLLGLLYLLENEEVRIKHVKWAHAMLVVFGILYIVNVSVTDKKSLSEFIQDRIDKNQNLYEQTSKNMNDVYLYYIVTGPIEGYSNYDFCVSDDAFSYVQKGCLKNIFPLSYITPLKEKVMNEYGINDPYIDAIDSNDIYLICAESEVELEFDMRALVERYICDRSGQDINLKKVKEYVGRNIYRAESFEYDPLKDYYGREVEDESAVTNYVASFKDSKIAINGHIKNADFSDDLYLDIFDSQTGEHYVSDICQSFSGRGDTLTSHFSIKRKLPDSFDEDDAIYIWRVSDDECVKMRVGVE